MPKKRIRQLEKSIHKQVKLIAHLQRRLSVGAGAIDRLYFYVADQKRINKKELLHAIVKINLSRDSE